jgi:broad specificity phosphatase PhoE
VSRLLSLAFGIGAGEEVALSMLIKLVRHGQSLANVGALNPAEVGEHTIGLTPLGKDQPHQAGQCLGPAFLDNALAYCSPFRRARETLAGLLDGAGVSREKVRVYEDPRLREVDHGYADVQAQEPLRRTHGWFYYRFHGGESPADCYDRTSGFLESLMRQAERKRAERVLIITHGLTIRCFVMRFLHLTVEQFDMMANPANCDVITLGPKDLIEQPLFCSGKWGVSGLRTREAEGGLG